MEPLEEEKEKRGALFFLSVIPIQKTILKDHNKR